MLDDDDRIAEVAEAADHADEALCVAGMQADGGLVEDVHRADEAAAEGGDEVDPLALTAGEGVAGPVERQVTEADVLDTSEPEADLLDGFVGDVVLVRCQVNAFEPGNEIVDVHPEQVVDGLAVHLDVERFGAQPAAATAVADRPPAVAAHHIFELDLVLLPVDPAEKVVDAPEAVILRRSRHPVPDFVRHFLRQLAPRFEDGDAVAL